MHAHREGDECTSKRWECRDLDRLFVANHYLLKPVQAFDGCAGHGSVDTASGLSVRSKDEERRGSLLLIFWVHSALWTLCPLLSLSPDLLAGWSGFV